MPDGHTHTRLTLYLAAPVAVASWIYGGPQAGIAAGAGCLAGIFVSPDLDIDTGYIGLYYLRKIPVIGPLISLLWRVIWWPYAKATGHRSVYSHGPLLGTLMSNGTAVVSGELPLTVAAANITNLTLWVLNCTIAGNLPSRAGFAR